MEKIFVLNPNLNLLNIKDAIEERLNKMKGILNCLMFANIQDEELDCDTTYHALWAMDGFLDEINYLKRKLDEIIN